MIHVKKWRYSLFCCLLFFACKSTDCGCPMADSEPVEELRQKDNLEYRQQWKKIAK